MSILALCVLSFHALPCHTLINRTQIPTPLLPCGFEHPLYQVASFPCMLLRFVVPSSSARTPSTTVAIFPCCSNVCLCMVGLQAGGHPGLAAGPFPLGRHPRPHGLTPHTPCLLLHGGTQAPARTRRRRNWCAPIASAELCWHGACLVAMHDHGVVRCKTKPHTARTHGLSLPDVL